MNKNRIVLALFGMYCAFASAQQDVPAFPGAEGAGAYAKGGRNGVEVFVTNLDDDGPGSLRAACALEEPRIVTFQVGGIVNLSKPIEIRAGRITIDGQTAPGDGVCLRGAGIGVKADDVVIRYLRIRPGDVLGKEVDGLCVSDSRRVIIDHCSVSWAVDEVLSVVGASDAVTVQWCMISEALHKSVHKKGAHGMGSLLRSESGVYSFHHCLYAHNNTRNPRPGDNYDGGPGVLLDFRNNVMYDWGGTCGYGAKERFRMNYAGNYLKPGPSTGSGGRTKAFLVGGPDNRLFVEDNFLEGIAETNGNAWSLIAWPKNLTEAERTGVKASQAFDTPAISATSARQAFEDVLADVGATLPRRDKVDERVVDAVRNGTGGIVNSQTEAGGWPEFRGAAGK